MENKFTKIYRAMGVLGEAAGIGAGIYAVVKDMLDDNRFYALLIVLLVLLIAVRILHTMKKRGKFKSVSIINADTAKGHISMMLGISALISTWMILGNQPFWDILSIVLIVMIFMSVMLTFMIKTFNKFKKIAEESEKK